MKTIKKVEDLQFYDDFMFCNVMMDESICTGVLDRLLNVHIARIDYKHSQEQLSDSYTAKNIRLDVYLDDGKTVYDIEMQCSKMGSIEKRVRYYQSKIDMDSSSKGIYYEAVKDSYIIFICKQDPHGCGFPRYEVKSYLEGQRIENGKTENLKTVYKDGTHKLFFNAKAYDKEPDARLRAFLEYVHNHKATDAFTKTLEDKVMDLKNRESFKSGYAMYNLHYRDILVEGYKEGRAEGLNEGLTKGISQGISQGMAQGITQGITQGIHQQAVSTARTLKEANTPIDLILRSTGLSAEEINAL